MAHYSLYLVLGCLNTLYFKILTFLTKITRNFQIVTEVKTGDIKTGEKTGRPKGLIGGGRFCKFLLCKDSSQ